MRFRILVVLILNNFLFAYDEPVIFYFLSNSKPHYLEKSGTFNLFLKEKFKFNFEGVGGEWKWDVLGKGFLIPFPSFSGYFKFMYKNFSFSISIFDRYQYVLKDKIWAMDEQGRIIDEIIYYDLNFIYSKRIGFSYIPVQKFVFKIAGDINYGFKGYKFKGKTIDTSLTYEDYSFSYSFGILYFENPETNFYIQYDSKVKIKYENLKNLFIPQQITTCLNFPFSQNLNIGIKNFIKYDKFFDYYEDKKKSIKTFDMAYDFLISPFIKNTSFYFSIYTFPLVYFSSSKGVGFIFGPKFNNFFIKEFFIMFEKGSWEVLDDMIFSITRYGIILNFSF